MAGHLKHGLALHSFIRQFESISVGGLRHAHTHINSGIQARTIPPCAVVHSMIGKHQQRVLPLHQAQPALICSAFNKTEIREKVKPVPVIETPQVPGSDSPISEPTVSGIGPITTPLTNRIIIKPPTVNTPKSASKNGNKYVLRLRRKRIKKRQLLKTRMKIWPVIRKLNFLRARKKERKLKAELDKYKKEAEMYDFLEEVKRDIAQAKKRGYHYDIFGSGTDTFGFGNPVEERKNLGGLLKSVYSKEQKKDPKND